MIRKLIALMLVVLVGCGGIQLELGGSGAYKTSNGALEFFVYTDNSNDTIFVKVKTQTGSPTLTAANVDNYYECHTKNKLAVCMIDGLAAQTRLELQVFCLMDCDFTIEAYEGEYYRMELHEEMVVVFDGEGDFIMVEVALSQALAATELKIEAIINNPEEMAGQLHLFASTAPNKPTPKDYQYKGEPIWKEGQGIFFSKDKFKPKDKIRIFMAGAKGMEVVITCFGLEGNIRRVQLGQSIYDDAGIDSSKKYILQLNPATTNKGDVSIRFMKYNGNCEVKIYAPNSTANNTLTADSADSTVQFTLSKEMRTQLGIQDMCFIEINAQQHSTYMLRANLDDEDFAMLDDDITVVGTVAYGEVDNYIYTLIATQEDEEGSNIRSFTLGAEMVGESLYYGIRRCEAMENGNGSCLVSSTIEARAQLSSLRSIPGVNHTDGIWRYFTFSYNIKNCTQLHVQQKVCVFHVACFHLHQSIPVHYQLHFEQTAAETTLQDGFGKRDRIQENQTKNYVFILKETANISEVRFYLSVITGDCLLSGALDRRQHRFEDPSVRFAYNHSLRYNGTINQRYFLQVQSFTNSYYSLLVKTVKALPQAGQSKNEPLQLQQGRIQNILLENGEIESHFWIRLTEPKQLYVQVNSQRADVDISVYVSHKRTATQKQVWHSTSNFVRISYANETATPYLEFLVVIRSKADKFFSIVYDEWGKCAPTNVNQPLQVDIPAGSYPRCFQFYITKLAPVMVVVVASYFDRGTGENTVFLEQGGGEEEQVKERITTYNVSEIRRLCPEFEQYSKGNYSTCILRMKIEIESAASLTLSVQYISEEMELFDGLQVFMKTPLSQYQAMHFKYNIEDFSTPIMVSLRSSTDTRYRMVAQIVNWDDYFKQSNSHIYPSFAAQTGMVAQSGHTGSTVLIVKPQEMENSRPTEKLLLVSLYVPTFEQVQAEFKIEVVQHTVPLHHSELKSGFVQKGTSRKYSFSAKDEELVVHINAMVPYCTKLQIFSIEGDEQSAILSQSLNNELLVIPTGEEKNYVVEVMGLESCTYEISYTKSSERIYQLVAGHPFSLDFKSGDRVYFLYFNSREESFRITSMVDHGSVHLRAKLIQNGQLKYLSAIVSGAKESGQWDFGSRIEDISLKVNNDSPNFCAACYYLVEATAVRAASATLYLHSKDSVLPLKENRHVKEALQPNDKIKYAYLKMAPFKLAFTVTSGPPVVSVTLTNNETYKTVFNFTESKDYIIPYEGPLSSGENAYQSDAFIIEVGCVQSCSYSILVDSNNLPRHLVDGQPYKFEANFEAGRCVQFVSLEGNHTTNLLLASDDTALIDYNISCYQRSVWQPCKGTQELVLKTKNSPEQINVNLRSLDGVYLVCVKALENGRVANVTAMHSIHLEFVPMQPNTYNSLSLTPDNPSVTIEMKNNQSQSIMVEIFECSGKIDFLASNDYSKLQANQSMKVDYSKTAGHYVVLLPSSQSTDLQFGKINLKTKNSSKGASVVYRYSYFEEGKDPLSTTSLSDSEIKYRVQDSGTAFELPVVESEGSYSIKNANYHVVVARSSGELNAALQCGTGSVLSKNQQVNAIENGDITTDRNSVEVVFSKEQIGNYIESDERYFVGAYCEVEIEEPNSKSKGHRDTVKSYRLIYDTTDVVARTPSVGVFTKAKLLFLWIILPALATLLVILAIVRYIIRRKQKAVETQFVEQPAAPAVSGSVLEGIEDNPGTQGVMITVSTTRDIIPTKLLTEI